MFALGRDREALERLAEVRTAVCDVTDEGSVREAFAAIGAVDVLVNNAGIAESAPLHRTTLESWGRHFDVNVTGPFLCMREVVPGMRERGRGAIVTVASTAARIGTPYTTAYTSSKHAAIGLTRAVASELSGTGVRVNAVCPTFVRTDLTARAIARIVETTGRTEAESEAALRAPVAARPAARTRRGGRCDRVPRLRFGGRDKRPGAGRRRRRDPGVVVLRESPRLARDGGREFVALLPPQSHHEAPRGPPARAP